MSHRTPFPGRTGQPRKRRRAVHNMFIHCTRKLYSRIPEGMRIGGAGATGDGVLGDWHASLHVIDRRQCVVFCHDSTRYALFLAGVTRTDFANLAGRHRELFLATLRESGLPEARVCSAALAMGRARCDHTTDRSVLGSLRVLRDDLEGLLCTVHNVMDLDPVRASVHLSHRPATARGQMIWPDRMMHEMVLSL